jgi:16S rRNA (adenine1518-N6/adenine1519-N6)-dimethyltransferase
MLRYSFKPNPKFNQNFIINKKIIDKVIEITDINKEDVILEIGPGIGFLTSELLDKSKEVIAIEKDINMVNILKDMFKNKDQLNIINEDFLNTDLDKLKFDKIVGFIPYSISQKIIYKINNICKSILIVQKEFANKLLSQEGFENYNAISVISQTYNNIKVHNKIGKSSFFPAPKCESVIIELTPKSFKLDARYNLFVKEIFRYSNKDLSKAIKLSNKILKIDLKFFEENISDNLKSRKVKLLNVKEIKDIYSKLYK